MGAHTGLDQSKGGSHLSQPHQPLPRAVASTLPMELVKLINCLHPLVLPVRQLTRAIRSAFLPLPNAKQIILKHFWFSSGDAFDEPASHSCKSSSVWEGGWDTSPPCTTHSGWALATCSPCTRTGVLLQRSSVAIIGCRDMSQHAEAWVRFATDRFSPGELSCIRRSPLVLQVQLENIATSVNGEILILQGCGIQKQPYGVHRSGRAHLL